MWIDRFRRILGTTYPVLLGALIGCWLSQPALAGTGGGATSGFQISNWQTGEGLPQNSALAITQTDDGFLWVGTFNGLARFDGKRFTVFNRARTPGLPADSISLLHTGGDGRLWMLADGRLVRRQRGEFREFPELPAFGALWCRMIEDAHGNLFVAGIMPELFRVAPSGEVTRFPLPPDTATRRALALGPEGELRVGAADQLYRLDGDAFVPTGKFNSNVWKLIRGTNDSWFAYQLGGGLTKIENGSALPDFAQIPGQHARVGVDTEGGVWAVESKVQRWRNGRWQIVDFGKEVRDAAFTDLFIDREQNVWIGTDGHGLFRLRPRPVEVYSADSGLSGRATSSVTEDQGGDLLVGHYWAGCSIRRDGRWQPLEPNAAMTVRSLLQTSDGTYYRAQNDFGLWFRQGDSPWERRTDCGILVIHALFEDRGGRLWVGGREGAEVLEQGEFRRVGEAGWEVDCFEQTDDGAIWIGTGQGLFRVSDGRIERFTAADGIGATSIHSLYAGRQGRLWIGTEGGGLTRWLQGRFSTIDSRRGLHDDVVAQILEDDHGFLWLGANRGIFRVSLAELNAVMDSSDEALHGRVFGRDEGLLNPECVGGVQPNCVRDRTGRLWFCTVDGVVMVDPERLPRSTIRPPVHIQRVLADGEVLSVGGEVDNTIASGLPHRASTPVSVNIPPGVRRIEIHYTGISLADPDGVRFRNRLIGLDDSWTPVGDRRVASFSALRPGRYHFEVMAENSDGATNPNPAGVVLAVAPQYYETIWFRLLVGGAVILAVFGLQQLRLRRLRQVEELRQRIARDLHDEVGANIGAISLLSGMAEAEEKPGATVSEIRDVAQQTAELLREVVWFVNPKFDSVGDLSSNMETLVRRLFPAGRVDFQAEIAAPQQKLSLSFRRAFFAIYKEALHNIVKHAAAASLRLHLVAGRHTVELTLEDDGRGFDPDQVSRGDGLQNMRARVKELGGTLELQSQPGQGTRLTLKAPLR